MSVQYCGTCGQPLIPGQLFCQHCGSRADENVAYGALIDENATRAAPLPGAVSSPSSGGTLYCGQCGALVNSQDRACRRCGAPVEFAPGLISDPSLTDSPTIRGNTPNPQAGSQASSPTRTYAGPDPGALSRQPPGWAAAPGTAAVQPPGWAAAPAYGSGADRPDEAPTFAINFPYAGTPSQAGRGAAAPGQRTPPYVPSGPGGPPKQGGQRWPLVLAVVLVALALIVGGSLFLLLRGSGNNGQTAGQTATAGPGITPTATTPPVTPSPTAVVLNTTTASALINQFYDDINNQQYDAAYDLLSPEYQQMQSRQNFKDGFQNTIQDTLMIQGAQMLSDGTVQVNVTLSALENRNGSQVTSCYSGYYIVEQENGQLLIKSGNLNPQSC